MSQSQQPTAPAFIPPAIAAAPLADPATARRSLAPPPPKFSDTIADFIARGLVGDPFDHEAIPESKQLSEARRKCREGNPFPLVAMQWPELVVSDDHPDAAIFRENLKLVESAAVTDKIRESIFVPRNPLLRLDWWQHIVIAAFFDDVIGEIYLAGGTGLGKGASTSMAVNLWYDAFRECRIHLTGRDREHARRNIFGETVKWFERKQFPGHGRATAEAIIHTNRHYAVLLNPDASSATAGEAFSGAHGENTLYTYDECTAHPKSFIENARRNAKLIVALANPRGVGWFKDGFASLPHGQRIGVVPGELRMRLCMMVGGEDAINVRFQRLKYPVAPKGGIEIAEGPHR